MSTGDFDGSVCHVVDKCTVVTDKHHGISLRCNELFQPLNRTNIEVVGWLVKQQEVWLLQEELSQFYSHAPTSRELTRWAVEILTSETKSLQCSLQFGTIVLSTHHLVAVVFVRESFH